MIEQNVKAFLKEIERGNCFGEKITIVAATKTRTAEEINRAIRAGVSDIGENRVQEFCDKFDDINGAKRHFIGHLQTNKVKYLIGRVGLYHSVDRDELIKELSSRSRKAGVVSDILIQINIGNEESKGGYPLSEGYSVYQRLLQDPSLRVKGFMAMLPISNDAAYLGELCDNMRTLFDKAKAENDQIEFLSMGMSDDWRLCVSHGANMIRIGTALFGARNYF